MPEHSSLARPQKVVIAGGSGFLGRSLADALLARGDQPIILSRSAARPDDLAAGIAWLTWDARTPGDWVSALDGAAAVINLVGRSVDCRKTPESKREILQSRVDSCRVLGEAMRQIRQPPPVWIQGATAHIVGDPEPRDTLCDEQTPPGPLHEMAPSVGLAWEKAFEEARLPGQRGVVLRISFVLGREGGALRRLGKVARWGLAGTVGPGTQWISWIHQADLNQMVLAALDDTTYQGAYMATAPHPVTNRDFMRALRRAYRRPWSPPAPAMGVRLVCRFILNTDPELALLGRRCVSTRLREEHGFTFTFPDIGPALKDLAR